MEWWVRLDLLGPLGPLDLLDLLDLLDPWVCQHAGVLKRQDLRESVELANHINNSS
jgi:hypothetical protein